MIGVAGKSPDILPRGNRAVPPDKRVVRVVKNPAGLDDVILGCIVKLGRKDLPDGVADCQHAANARGRIGGNVSGVEAGAVTDEKMAVAVGERAFLDAGEGFGGNDRPGRGAALVPWREYAFGQGGDRR